MRRISLLVIVCWLLVTQLPAKPGPIAFLNDETQATINSDRISLKFALDNPTGQQFQGKFRIDLLAPDDSVKAGVTQDADLAAGTTRISADIPFRIDELPNPENKDVYWYRIRANLNDQSGKTIVTKIWSLSEIAPELFTLRVAARDRADVGKSYVVRVTADHFLKKTPVAGVRVRAVLLRNKTEILSNSAITNDKGWVTFSFDQIPFSNQQEMTLQIEAVKNGIHDEYKREISLETRAEIIVSNDKPIYQPGQTYHARILAFTTPIRRAIPSAAGLMQIKTPDGEVIYKAPFVTNEFGVASVEWKLPDDLRLGDYNVNTNLEDGGYAANGFKVTRYELPTFEVKTESDRQFYLTGQNARVTAIGTYLFGKPVPRGHVRIVRERERDWNYNKQKWDIVEEAVYEGTADEQGRFTTTVKLDKALEKEDRKKGDEWDERRPDFTDLNFAAYFTDPTTGRTEQSRFDLRVSREPIHIYVTSHSQARGLPLDFFITTSTADGLPVSAEVSVTEESGKVSFKTQTNNRGQARYVSPTVLRDDDKLNLKLKANDALGRTGMVITGLYIINAPAMRITTDRVLYSKGQPIRVHLQSNEENSTYMVDIVAEGRIQRALTIDIKNYTADFTLPYDASFEGGVRITAFKPDLTYYSYIDTTERTVLFPIEKDLSVNVKFSKTEYKPGEAVTADFTAKDSNGTPLMSALGLNVIDKAIEVRANSDSSFGGGFRHQYFSEGLTDDNDGGPISLRELYKFDPSKPLPPEIGLAAEMLAQHDNDYNYEYVPYFDRGLRADLGLNLLFQPLFQQHLKQDNQILQPPLDSFLKQNGRYPANLAEAKLAFKLESVDPDAVRDPWGNPYQIWTGVEGPLEGMKLISAGPDQKPGTDDDTLLSSNLSQYFAKTGALVTEIVGNYHFKTDKFILDSDTFKKALKHEGLDTASMLDKWGTPYEFIFNNQGRYVTIKIVSRGPDKKFGTFDDFSVSEIRQDYLAEIESTLSNAVYDHFNRTNLFPSSLEEFLRIVRESGTDFNKLNDPLGGKFYATLRIEERYDDSLQIDTDAAGQRKVKVDPVKRKFQVITIRSTGPDHREGTSDDFTVTILDQMVAEQRFYDSKATVVEDQLADPGTIGRIGSKRGGIRGTILDPNEAAISGATVEIVIVGNEAVRKTSSAGDGTFAFYNLVPGFYKLRISASGFKNTIINDILVRGGGYARIKATLSVGAVSEAIVISGSSEVLQTQSATLAGRKEALPQTTAKGNLNATPRIRQYFPENLLWQPMLVTDEKGHARLEFKLADSITTWKMGVIGSTKDGRIAVVQADIKAFQPFFIEPDPPKVLTEGDEISLPVVVRNYTDQKQDVKLSLTPAAWFKLQDKSEKNVATPSNDSVTEHFRLKAIASGEQKETITGIGSTDSDAVEKTTTVHPDGEEISQTIGDLLTDDAKFEFNVPDYALTSGRQLKLKLYPNLFSQALEGIEGIVQRPGGCAEQTISSTYPNLLVLQYLKTTGKTLPAVQSAAQRNLQMGYDRLTNFITSDGGVGYFIGHKSDFALTAYALRFLADASEFISIDDEVQKKMQDWLLARQDADGRWITDSARYHRIYEDGAPRETAYVCSVLARSLKKDDPKLVKGFEYVEKAIATFPDPYTIALYTQAQLDAGNDEKAIAAAKQLEQAALTEGSLRYWNLEVNTPFYGWGRAGRIETTALALEAITRAHRLPQWRQSSTGGLMNQALLFLIKEKDRYGVWYSSQATVRVLHSLIVLSDEQIATPSTDLAIKVNGRSIKPITLPSGNELSNYIDLDISGGLRPGNNVIELHRTGTGQSVAVQVVEAHYIPWSKAEKVGTANNLRLAVKLNKDQAAAGEAITYSVEAERTAFRGYGMMLAEIGLPPGCDVDRASLEKAVKDSGWSLWRYDVLPDRVVFYIWPYGEITKINFDVKPRFAMYAKLTASVLYDYYNPEARVNAVPQVITVR